MTPKITGRRFVSAIALAGAAMLALTLPATAATNPTSPTTQRLTTESHTTGVTPANVINFTTIVNYHGLCLDMPNNSTTKGTQVQLWSCDSKPQQVWETYSLYGGNQFFLIRDQDSNMCLSIQGNDQQPGGAVIQWPCNYSGTDRYEVWYLENAIGGPGNEIINDGSDNCGCGMHPSGNESYNGVKVYASRPDDEAYLWNFPQG
jgi:hypothetical protein